MIPMLRNEETEAGLFPQSAVSPLPHLCASLFFPNTVQPLSLFQRLSDSPEHPAVFPLPLLRTHHPLVWPPWHAVCPALCWLFRCLCAIPRRSQVLLPECHTGLCSLGASTVPTRSTLTSLLSGTSASLLQARTPPHRNTWA